MSGKLKTEKWTFGDSYRCKVCRVSFRKFIFFEGHFAFKNKCRTRNKGFLQCYVCSKNYRYLSELKYHLRRHVNKVVEFKESNTILNGQPIEPTDEMDSNQSSTAADHVCNICKRNFRTKFHLSDHMITHSKTKAVTKSTPSNGSKTTTIKSENKSTPGEKMFCCRVLMMLDPLPYLDCKRVMNPIVNSDENFQGGAFQCDTCKFSFTTQISLRFHQRLYSHQTNTPIEPIEPVKPIEPAKAIDTIKPIDAIKSIEPIKPIEPAKAIGRTKPIETKRNLFKCDICGTKFSWRANLSTF